MTNKPRQGSGRCRSKNPHGRLALQQGGGQGPGWHAGTFQHVTADLLSPQNRELVTTSAPLALQGGVGSSATALPASPAGASAPTSTAWQFSTGDTDAMFSSYVPQWNSKGTSFGPWCTFASSVRHLSMMAVWHKQSHTQRSCPVWISCRFRNSFGLGRFKEAFFKEPIWVII